MPIQRSAADWAALCRAELDGQEAPGTVGRLLSKASGKPAADDGGGAETKSLLRLLELLHSPTNLKKHIADLDRSATAATAAAQEAKAEQAKLAKAREDLAAERGKHEAAIARETSEHKAALVAANTELAAVKKQAAELKAKAESDAAAASTAKAEQQRRLRLMEGASD
jgi:hypothetical protein